MTTHDEVEEISRAMEGLACTKDPLGHASTCREAAALIRRLRVQRDDVKEVADSRLKTILRLEEQLNDARNKALDEAAAACKDAMRFRSCTCHSPVQTAIANLKSQEPTP